MKKLNFKYILLSLAILAFGSCDDDDPISAGIGDPSTKNIINLESTVASDLAVIGEGNVIGFSVTLPQGLSSDATVTARITLDNGNTSTGTATVAAGATTGTGTITVPADDGVITGDTVGGVSNAAQLSLIAILLDELEPNTTYTITSNTVDLGIYADTLPSDSGLNILFDWEDPATNDLDMQVIDRAFTFIFETSESGNRFESDLFQNAGRDDGIYDVYTIIFTASPTVDLNYDLLFTLPDGSLEVINGTLPAGSPNLTRIPIATFEKSTDAVTGEVSYINIGAL
ncbi:hypothetical protein [Aquimarina sp. 2201CG5-10]|uniref:hypothetical protein n=1 Tax=Aquimarina callyspongiae TaxID=3098150 RepID=UPI002AB52BA5|nr:hypothetical protein [Aquimarina sp. 2201CG5-10]MDY8134434.1 hypothetical protein [Aquimarina sp. 2201CG5-10]